MYQSIWLYSFSKMQVSIEKRLTWKNKQIKQKANCTRSYEMNLYVLTPLSLIVLQICRKDHAFAIFTSFISISPSWYFFIALSLSLSFSLLYSLYRSLFLSFLYHKIPPPYKSSTTIYNILLLCLPCVPFKATSLHGFLSLKEQLMFLRGGKERENMKYIIGSALLGVVIYCIVEKEKGYISAWIRGFLYTGSSAQGVRCLVWGNPRVLRDLRVLLRASPHHALLPFSPHEIDVHMRET